MATGILSYLEDVPDPRREQGLRYPLRGVLAMLLLAAVNGETSLRGMWLWGCEHWTRIKEQIGIERESAPQYGTLWELLSRLAIEDLGASLMQWAEQNEIEMEIVDVDGKVLRGSKRRNGKAARQMIVAAAQGVGVVLKQQGVEEEDAIEAAWKLLQGMDLEEKVVTLDAGLNQKKVVNEVLEQGGATLGTVKGNHGKLYAALQATLQEVVAQRPADVVQNDRGHGRVEKREFWWLPVDKELRKHLEGEYGRPQVRWCGLVRRTWRHLHEEDWHVNERIWLYQSARSKEGATPQRLSAWTRGHWHIENRVFWVLDVTFSEDRNHARQIAPALHFMRSAAINLIRRQGFRYVPDGRRAAAARDDRGFVWLDTS